MESSTEALLVALSDSNSDSDCSIEDRIDEEEIESEFGSGTPSTVSCYSCTASETSTSTSSCNSTVPSLLEVLHASKLSEISRLIVIRIVHVVASAGKGILTSKLLLYITATGISAGLYRNIFNLTVQL